MFFIKLTKINSVIPTYDWTFSLCKFKKTHPHLLNTLITHIFYQWCKNNNHKQVRNFPLASPWEPYYVLHKLDEGSECFYYIRRTTRQCYLPFFCLLFTPEIPICLNTALFASHFTTVQSQKATTKMLFWDNNNNNNVL